MRRSYGFLRLLFFVPLVALIAACGSSSSAAAAPPVTINVFAASSLKDAFIALNTDFHAAHTNVTVTFNFAGSQQLAQQITQGAPVDVFASANDTQMQVAIKGGEVTDGSQKTFVKNRLIVVTPKNNPAQIKTLQDLAKPGIKLVLAASTVPVGQYSLTFLSKANADPSYGSDYQANVLKNVVSYEQDEQTVFTKVQLGEADAGIVYTSDISTKGDEVSSITIPDALNTIAVYPIAPLKSSGHATTANQFIDYVLSAAGQATLTKYGFIAAGS